MKSALELAAEMLGHSVTMRSRKVKSRKTGKKFTVYWAECDCGYESNPGKSFKFSISSAAGHLKRVRDRLTEDEFVDGAPPCKRPLDWLDSPAVTEHASHSPASR